MNKNKSEKQPWEKCKRVVTRYKRNAGKRLELGIFASKKLFGG